MPQTPTLSRPQRAAALVGVAFLCVACGVDSLVTAPASVANTPAPVADNLLQLECTAIVKEQSVTCEAPAPAIPDGAHADIIGGQNLYLTLTSSNFSYDAGTQLLQFDVTVQNLLNEAIGSPDGVLSDTAGVKVFFYTQPIVTGGTGTVTILNADGTRSFLAANQKYFKYPGKLVKDQVSGPKTWKFDVPATVTAFTFTAYVAATVQPLLVVNEMFANPGGTITDASGEWFEIYNAGTRAVNMLGLIVRDSAASGLRPPHAVSVAIIVPPGGYVVFGNTMNTTNNGGVPVDYAYGAALVFANSLDRVKIERVFEGDTLMIDEAFFRDAAISAQNGISRELTNPLLDNSNIDGSNWADALVTAVYGPGGRGTPKAQNSTFTP